MPKAKRVRSVIAANVDTDLRRKVEEIAKSEERTISQIIKIALREYVERKTAGVAA